MTLRIVCDGKMGDRHPRTPIPWSPGPTQMLNNAGELIQYTRDDGEHGDGETDVILRLHAVAHARCRFACPRCTRVVVATEEHMRLIWQWLEAGDEPELTLEELQILINKWSEVQHAGCRDTMRALRAILST